MLLLNTRIKLRDHLILILLYLVIQMPESCSKYIDATNTGKRPVTDNRNKTTCDEARSQCDRLYSVLSTVEEDCKTYRIYLGCLSMLKSTQTLCQADFHYWMMLSTTEKLISEKCSPGDTSPIEPPREIFNYPISPKSSKTSKISSLSPCLDSLQNSPNTKSQYHTCALFGHPNLITYAGERQTCRLQGAWPLVNNRYISVQISGHKYNQFHFLDDTASSITQISVILKPDGKCLGDLTVPTLIYVASARVRLPTLLLNGRRDQHQSQISVKSIDISESHEQVELAFGYINTRIIISRVLVAQGEYSLTVSVLLPSQVAMARPRSKQQSLVRELCSLGCPTPESIDDLTLLATSNSNPQPHQDPVVFCLVNGLKGAFFDVCFLMLKLINHNAVIKSSETKKSIENFISISLKHSQANVAEFSKLISESFALDLRSRTAFQAFKPLWKVQQLDRESRRRNSSSIVTINILLTTVLSVVLLEAWSCA